MKEYKFSEALQKEIDLLESKGVQLDVEAVKSKKLSESENNSSFASRIISILGGFISCLLFLLALYSVNILNNTLVSALLALLSWGVSLWINKKHNTVTYETFSVFLYFMCFVFVIFTLDSIQIYSEIIPSIVFIGISLITIWNFRSYTLAFLSTITLIVASIMLIQKVFNNGYCIAIFLSFLIFIETILFLRESNIIAKKRKFLELYRPIRMGIFFILLLSTYLIDNSFLRYFEALQGIWIVSVSTFIALGSVVYFLIKSFTTSYKNYIWIFSLLGISAFIPTVWMPGISICMLLLLLSFRSQYSIGFVLSIVSLIYFISSFYYNLSYSLLTKSLLLMGTGIFMLAIYGGLYLKFSNNEKK